MRNYPMLQIILNLDALLCSISIHIHCEFKHSLQIDNVCHMYTHIIIDEVHMHNCKTLIFMINTK